MNRTAALALLALGIAPLTACGGARGGDDELMRRVAQAEQAANRAEAAASRAEAAAARAGGGSAPEPEPTVYEPAPDMDTSYGQGAEPVPEDG